MLKAILKRINPQSLKFTSPKTSPKHLFLVKRVTRDKRKQFYFTPSFSRAIHFTAESVTV